MDSTYVPRDSEWERAPDDAYGWHEGRLEAVLRTVGETNGRGLVIVHQGRVLAERYWEGADVSTRADVASAQKSVVSFLVGVAQVRKLLSVDDSVAAILGRGWSASGRHEAAITVRHLLTMTSGLDDELGFESEPGSRWRYNTPAYHQIKHLLEAAAGSDLQSLSEEWLLEPTGMESSAWEDRPTMRDPMGRVLSGFITSTRDMARFGLLMLRRGVWGSRRLLDDQDYLRESVSPSQRLNPAYGYLWWLNAGSSYLLPGDRGPFAGPLLPDAPHDAVGALGAGDQKIYFSAELDLVWARCGGPAGPRAAALSEFDNVVWRMLSQATPPR